MLFLSLTLSLFLFSHKAIEMLVRIVLSMLALVAISGVSFVAMRADDYASLSAAATPHTDVGEELIYPGDPRYEALLVSRAKRREAANGDVEEDRKRGTLGLLANVRLSASVRLHI